MKIKNNLTFTQTSLEKENTYITKKETENVCVDCTLHIEIASKKDKFSI